MAIHTAQGLKHTPIFGRTAQVDAPHPGTEEASNHSRPIPRSSHAQLQCGITLCQW